MLVRQISSAAGTDLRLAEPFLATIVTQVVESDAFRTVFDEAVSTTHRIVVDRNTRKIVLDLTAAYDQIKAPLQQVAPKLARQLPSRRQLEVVVLERSQLSTAWDVIDDVKRGVLVVSIAAIALVVLGVALASERWKALARVGWVVAGGSLGLLGALWIGRLVVEDRISDGRVADAFGAGFAVITSALVVQIARGRRDRRAGGARRALHRRARVGHGARRSGIGGTGCVGCSRAPGRNRCRAPPGWRGRDCRDHRWRRA